MVELKTMQGAYGRRFLWDLLNRLVLRTATTTERTQIMFTKKSAALLL